MSRTGGPVLALDSCGRVTTLALGSAETATEPVRTLELPPRTAGAALVPALSELLGSLRPSELSALVVVCGPGSFTGIRTGVSAVKALAQAAELPVVGLSRLAVLSALGGQGYAALDAGRGQVYLRLPSGGEAPADGCTDRLVSQDEAQALAGGHTVVVCEERPAAWFHSTLRVAEPTAADALRCAAARIGAMDWDDPVLLDALYLWREDQMLSGPKRAAG